MNENWSKPVKFCKDCVYFRLPSEICTGPHIKKDYNLVTGKMTVKTEEASQCHYQRYEHHLGTCGKDAQFFQSNS